LAFYRILQPEFEDNKELQKLMQIILADETVLVNGIDAYLEKRFGITSEKSEVAWELVCENFEKIGKKQYGKNWIYEQSVIDQKRCFVNIKKCGLNDFFKDNGSIDVLNMICALDYVWGDALETYGIEFQRPTTLAEGCDACRFQFFKKTQIGHKKQS
jgi:hypothetical protein